MTLWMPYFPKNTYIILDKKIYLKYIKTVGGGLGSFNFHTVVTWNELL